MPKLQVVDLTYSITRNFFYLPIRHGVRWTLEGAHRVPAFGPVILASNHVSNFDPFVLADLVDRQKRRIRFLAKTELFKNPIMGFLMRDAGQIPVDRFSQDAALSLRFASGALQQGECIGIFPEGTVSPDLELLTAKTGTARLAQMTGAPILPMAHFGTQRIWRKNAKKVAWKLPVSVVVGATQYVDPDENIVDATDRLMEEIARCLRRAREIYPDRKTNAWWWREPDTAVAKPTKGKR